MDNRQIPGNAFINVVRGVKIGLLIFAMALGSCSDGEKNFIIRGELENAAGSSLRLYEMSTYDLVPTYDVEVDENGKFSIQGRIDRVRFMSLRESAINYLTLIVFPGDRIEVRANLENLQGTAEVSGSPESELAVKLNREMNSTLLALDSLGTVYRGSLDDPDTDILALREEVRVKYEEIAEAQRQFTIDFIGRNTGSLASLMALYQQTDPSTFVLSGKDDFKYYEIVDSALIEKYPDLDYTLTLNENVREMKKQLDIREFRENMLSPGNPAPEISLPDPGGDLVELSSLRGNYVLVGFWAAWSPESREENRHLSGAYNRYRSRGFEIYQVSLDRNREAWINAIEKDNIQQWTNVSDLQFWSSAVVPLYNLREIPANFLLDPEGNIIAVNVPGIDLGSVLEELLN